MAIDRHATMEKIVRAQELMATLPSREELAEMVKQLKSYTTVLDECDAILADCHSLLDDVSIDETRSPDEP